MTEVTRSLSEQDQKTKSNALICYACLILGSLTGVFYISGGLLAMLKRGASEGSIFADHIENAVTIFWASIVLTVIGIFSLPLFGIGYLIIVATSVWVLFRCVKGWLRLMDNRSFN